MFEDPLERRYWMAIWDKLFSIGIPDSWAYRWFLVCISNSGLTVLPNENLVTNIGFGDGATHTTDESMSIQSTGLKILSHPSLVCRDSIADAFSFDNHFGGRFLKSKKYRLRQLISRCKNSLFGLFD